MKIFLRYLFYLFAAIFLILMLPLLCVLWCMAEIIEEDKNDN